MHDPITNAAQSTLAALSCSPESLAWLHQYAGQRVQLACVFGFTDTGLVPGISAAGATPADRQFTAIADAEFLASGLNHQPRYPLPPLTAGVSPAVITRALIEYCRWPLTLFNAGLIPEHLQLASVSLVDLGGQPAHCLSTGQALPPDVVQQLFQRGLHWGELLSRQRPDSILAIGECVVGGTTTALGVLLGLGVAATDKVNSSHRICNHQQKYRLVQQGLEALPPLLARDPLAIVAAVGDPMQPVVAGMAIAASRHNGVLLAGGTQMLAVYTLAAQIAQTYKLPWQPEAVMIGTTSWVATDPSGNTQGLLDAIASTLRQAKPCLLVANLDFNHSRYPALQAYEQGYVKEGVALGGAAILASLSQQLSAAAILRVIEAFMERYVAWQSN